MEGKITKRLVESQQPGPREFYVWDAEVTGFGLRVKPSGHLSYVLRYTEEGRKYQVTIGRHGSPWVIPSPRTTSHLVNLEKPWLRIRQEAGLRDLRIHDLRHSFASVAANLGLSLPMIGAMLGHKKAATTQRYAHLAATPLKDASNLIAKGILGAIRRESA